VLHYAAQGLHRYAPQGLHYAAHGPHSAAQRLHSAAQGLQKHINNASLQLQLILHIISAQVLDSWTSCTSLKALFET
jgi:hypothetical protein